MLCCVFDESDVCNVLEDKQRNVLIHVERSLTNNIITTKNKIKKTKRKIIIVNLQICRYVVYNRFRANLNREHILRELKHKKYKLITIKQQLSDNLFNYQMKLNVQYK